MITEREYVQRLMAAQEELRKVYSELAQMPEPITRGGLPRWPGWGRGMDLETREWALGLLAGSYSLISESLMRGPGSIDPALPAPHVTVQDR